MDRAELMTEHTPIKGKGINNRIQSTPALHRADARTTAAKQSVAVAARRSMLLGEAAQVQRDLLIVDINLTLPASGQYRHHRAAVRRALLQTLIPGFEVRQVDAFNRHLEPGINKAAQRNVTHAERGSRQIRLCGQGFVDDAQQTFDRDLCDVDLMPVLLRGWRAQYTPEHGAKRTGKARRGPVHPLVRLRAGFGAVWVKCRVRGVLP